MTRAISATLAVAIAALAGPALAAASDPKAETQGPADLTATTATFKANVVLSALGSVTWDYGTTTAYGMTTPAVQTSLIAVNQNVTMPVTGLLPDTTYHVRAGASALLTLLQGKDVTFKTKKADPKTTTVTTPPAPTTRPIARPSRCRAAGPRPRRSASGGRGRPGRRR